MDDLIVLSDDDAPSTSNQRLNESEDECIVIDETTIVEQSSHKTFSTEFSFKDLVSKKTRSPGDKLKKYDAPFNQDDEFLDDKRFDPILLDDDFDEFNDYISKYHPKDNVKQKENEKEATKKRKISVEVDDQAKIDKSNAKRLREEQNQLKLIEKDKKKEEMRKKKNEKEREKETRKIEREISAAINSKSEQYTFCHIGKGILDLVPGLKVDLELLYLDRNIENQLVIEDDLGTRIEWRRRCIELRENDEGMSERFEYISTQDLYAVVVPSSTLKDVISANTLKDFIVEQRAGFKAGRSTMIIVCFGKLDVQKKKLHHLTLDIYEKFRAQIVQIENKSELSLFTAQYLRSLSRREKKRLELEKGESSSSGGHKIQHLGEKGIVIGSRDEIVSDWWNKMLKTIDRMSDAQRRAIVKLIPDPIVGIAKYSQMDYSEAIKEIGDQVAENNRKVGPVMAHRIYTMLTDQTGTAIVE